MPINERKAKKLLVKQIVQVIQDFIMVNAVNAYTRNIFYIDQKKYGGNVRSSIDQNFFISSEGEPNDNILLNPFKEDDPVEILKYFLLVCEINQSLLLTMPYVKNDESNELLIKDEIKKHSPKILILYYALGTKINLKGWERGMKKIDQLYKLKSYVVYSETKKHYQYVEKRYRGAFETKNDFVLTRSNFQPSFKNEKSLILIVVFIRDTN
jgi:hypothetical protein